ncbi:MAG: DeoR/GlpR family DNA-binding transcription regulator [Spirochaetota bacterium]
MSSDLIPADRQERIHSLLREKGVAKVAELSRMFGVSELTIRRDLEVLERKEVLERTHGGAIYNQRMRQEPLYEQKYQLHRKQKEAIGKAAAGLVEDGDTLFINSGSTTREVIRNLTHRKIRVITSNISAVLEAGKSQIELILTGGMYRPRSNSLVGTLAALSLEQVYGSKAIIGVDGLSFKYGLTHPVLEEAEIARQMIERTPGPVIIVADHSKLGVVSNFVTTPLNKVNILVTDEGIDEEYMNNLKKESIEVVIAARSGNTHYG